MAPKRKVGNANAAPSKKTKQEEPKSSSDLAPAKISFSVEHWWVYGLNAYHLLFSGYCIEGNVAAAVKAEGSSNGGKDIC